MSESCHDSTRQVTAVPPPGRRLLVVSAVFGSLFFLSFLPPLAALNTSLLSYLATIWWAVLLGLFLGGCIDYFVPDGFIVRFLGSQTRFSILNAAVAGLLMSACSHGILAIAIQLHKKGAGTPAVITFLLASPWANLPMNILMFSFFGAQAVLIIGGAVAVAIASGFVFLMFDRLGWIEASRHSGELPDYEWTRVRQFGFRESAVGVASGAMSLANMVLWWILIGVLIAAFIGAYVPDHLFMQYLGPDLPGVMLTLLFATVIEVCSEGSSPIAFEIFNKVGVIGNPFIFLMAGVATDYTEIGLLWSNIGKRTAILLPIVTVPQIVLLALWFNSL